MSDLQCMFTPATLTLDASVYQFINQKRNTKGPHNLTCYHRKDYGYAKQAGAGHVGTIRGKKEKKKQHISILDSLFSEEDDNQCKRLESCSLHRVLGTVDRAVC